MASNLHELGKKKNPSGTQIRVALITLFDKFLCCHRTSYLFSWPVRLDLHSIAIIPWSSDGIHQETE